MNVSKRGSARFLASSLMLLVLFSSIGSTGHGAGSLSLPALHDSLALTVNPNKSVGVAWNTTTSLGTLTQNVSSLFTSGYAVHSSSSFQQQSSDVLQTTTIQYQLPTPAVSIFKSISLTATQTGLTGSGSLTITTNVPTSTITSTYSTSPTQVKVNTTAQFYFSQSLFCRNASCKPNRVSNLVEPHVWRHDMDREYRGSDRECHTTLCHSNSLQRNPT